MNKLELKVPPPAAALLVAVAMWLVASRTDALSFALPERRALSMVLAALGIAVSAAGTWSFWRARTTVNPTRPEAASSLVTTGVFRVTRNPMYLGLVLALPGWAAHLANVASLAGPLDPLVTSFVRDEVAALLPRLEEVVQEPLQKARLKDVRRAVKRTRMVIAAHLDEMK